MGTRTNVLLDHSLPDIHDSSTILSRLAAALPEALAMGDYWEREEMRLHTKPADLDWVYEPWWAKHVNPDIEQYQGPGAITVQLSASAIRIRTGGRWRGFFLEPELRRVHLEAFRSIADAFSATVMVLFGDEDDINEIFWDGGSQSEAIKWLQEHCGLPQPSVDMIAPEVIVTAEQCVPSVWYTEELSFG